MREGLKILATRMQRSQVILPKRHVEGDGGESWKPEKHWSWLDLGYIKLQASQSYMNDGVTSTTASSHTPLEGGHLTPPANNTQSQGLAFIAKSTFCRKVTLNEQIL